MLNHTYSHSVACTPKKLKEMFHVWLWLLLLWAYDQNMLNIKPKYVTPLSRNI